MGFFDFFRRKPGKPPEEEVLTPLAAEMPEVRCHHYYFAHYALRTIAFKDPLAFLGVLASEDAERFLRDVLQAVTEHCRKSEPETDFAVEDVVIHKTRIGPYPCIVVEMPAAIIVTEAIFVAGVLVEDLADKLPADHQPCLRYFTLEVGIALEDRPAHVLCEWTAEGSHRNYGDGPDADLHSFVEALRKKVLRKKQDNH